MPGLLHDVLARRAAAHPAAPAFTVDGVGTLDYLSWHLGARRDAAGLAALGARPGQRVVLAFEDGDWLRFATCFMGVLAAGGVAVPVRAPVPRAHLLSTAAQVGAAGLVVGEAHPEADAMAFGGWLSTAAALTTATPPVSEAVRRAETDPAAVILTSGTTGAAKAVLSSHRSLTDDWEQDDDVPEAQPNALFTAVAIGTNAAQSVLKSCLINGVHVVLGQPFAPERLAALIDEHRVSAMSLVPTTARLAVAALRRQGRAPARIRSVVSSSAPLDQPTVDGLAEVFPQAEIFNVYTIAEGGAGLQHRCLPGRPPALGRLGDDARVVDGAGRDVAPGQVGELWLRDTGPVLSYLEPAGATETGTRYLADGWIATGDLCRLDDDALVHFVERADDVIVSGGLNIASATVEAALRTHPAVREVAVFGVPHTALGRAVTAAVVLETPTELAAGLRDYCAERLPGSHVPVDIVVLDELPVTPNGKVRKRLLAEDYVRAHRPEVAGPETPEAEVEGMETPEAEVEGTETPEAEVEGTETPEGEVERTVFAAFRATLAVEPIQRDSDFFRLGGHSLLATRLAAELERRTGRSVRPALVLRYPRAGDLSDALRRSWDQPAP
ncbi:AMP-binding protein [Nonomuraea endophytica]|uniref:Acyl-CoA synthetase (AMP-forming)/AMP-acid ligase II n=1 Tax=Nonomuraea endophytica TaxID=714136 RepID=A0A7W7ZYZ7_9ACTN|nr:AMP-binding protein [Nonomuraea endophytica]MBB5076441.1 acyl-CoA synthetase (AMP-forming)/AMP-acid ligase II [Nonomuraea endophytica]